MSSSVRRGIITALIHGKLFSPGKVVHFPGRQLHFGERYFGSNALLLKLERLLQDKDVSEAQVSTHLAAVRHTVQEIP